MISSIRGTGNPPAAIAPTRLPMLVPTVASYWRPGVSRARRTPTCAMPRMPPPPSTRTVRGRRWFMKPSCRGSASNAMEWASFFRRLRPGHASRGGQERPDSGTWSVQGLSGSVSIRNLSSCRPPRTALEHEECHLLDPAFPAAGGRAARVAGSRRRAALPAGALPLLALVPETPGRRRDRPGDDPRRRRPRAPAVHDEAGPARGPVRSGAPDGLHPPADARRDPRALAARAQVAPRARRRARESRAALRLHAELPDVHDRSLERARRLRVHAARPRGARRSDRAHVRHREDRLE